MSLSPRPQVPTSPSNQAFLKKQKVSFPESDLESDSGVPSVSMTNTRTTPDQPSTPLTAPSVELEETKIDKGATDLAGLTTDLSLPPKPSFETMEIQNERHAEPDSTLPINNPENPGFQPQPPARSWTGTVDQQTIQKCWQMLLANASSGRDQGRGEQPNVTFHFGNVQRLEINNGNFPRYQPSSEAEAVSAVETVKANMEKSRPKNAGRSKSQAKRTPKSAWWLFSTLFDRFMNRSRPKDFPYSIIEVEDGHACLQELRVLLDTGSKAGNLIPYSEVKNLGLLDQVRSADVPYVISLGGNQIKVEGSLDIVGKWNGRQTDRATFHVVGAEDNIIDTATLGTETINTFRLMRMRVGLTEGHGVNGSQKDSKAAQTNMNKEEEDIQQNAKDIQDAKMRKKKQQQQKLTPEKVDTSKSPGPKDDNSSSSK
ncbi:MAG: hypothetical protein Q9227_003755 [Pyrenula ochraceoflavens]